MCALLTTRLGISGEMAPPRGEDARRAPWRSTTCTRVSSGRAKVHQEVWALLGSLRERRRARLCLSGQEGRRRGPTALVEQVKPAPRYHGSEHRPTLLKPGRKDAPPLRGALTGVPCVTAGGSLGARKKLNTRETTRQAYQSLSRCAAFDFDPSPLARGRHPWKRQR